jgi:hypothetical protein
MFVLGQTVGLLEIEDRDIEDMGLTISLYRKVKSAEVVHVGRTFCEVKTDHGRYWSITNRFLFQIVECLFSKEAT